MGNRLIVNIENNGVLVASGYYHWSAATQPTIAIIQDMVKAIQDQPTLITKPFDSLAAIHLLEQTGAGVVTEDLPIVSKKYPNSEVRVGTDRSDGLINITQESIEKAKEDSIGEATLDVGTLTVDLGGIVYQYDDLDEYKDVNEQDDDDEEPIKDETLKISDLTFDEFLTLSNTIDDLVKNGFKVAKQPDGKIIELIE